MATETLYSMENGLQIHVNGINTNSLFLMSIQMTLAITEKKHINKKKKKIH